VPAAACVDRVNARLLDAIRKQLPNISIHSSTPITYSRLVFQHGFINIDSFESGEILVSSKEDAICVRYYLGTKAYCVSAAGVVACALLFLWKGVPLTYVGVETILCVFLIVGRLLYSLSNIRFWFKSIVLSAVNEKS
jgi:hypothetical protein